MTGAAVLDMSAAFESGLFLPAEKGQKRTCDGYLGCDVGSVSAKMVVIDDDTNILAKTYLHNRNLIETVKHGLAELESQSDGVEIRSVGCAGSGRALMMLILGGDIKKTEILAHTTGALHYYPAVNTIFDIGGEDCKIITLEDGVWKNYIMNNICGAGTGAMIESIAGALNVNIEDVGDLALESKIELGFPGKCGVLCQSAVVSRKNKGARNEDILMGVCRALINNYLTLAKSIELKPPYVFEGATARNKALVKALEEQLGHEVLVPEYCESMGAIGMAILARDNTPEETRFRGFRIKDLDIRTETFVCGDCPNGCEVTRIPIGDEVSYLDSKCGKYT
ncbi:MAG: 2-hydroxyglutaryl-CoA dehydratase [Candidatus Bathyarchaeota archaeon]|nr:MAG: 2-hydroxyglutaryl-CoA dehydratase [Candidatus Bathyarchaeota archaeon]